MAGVPANPKIYHITHLRNLPRIVNGGRLCSDQMRVELGLDCDLVGMPHIKQRRLKEIEVACHPGTHVGEYVPFYFCPRSIMLFILYKGNHQDLNYKDGQNPIIHLQADLREVVEWAYRNNCHWAFSDRNAGNRLADFFSSFDQLNQLNWQAIESNQWTDPIIKEDKQAEFLVYREFPWPLIEQIGVIDENVAKQVSQTLSEMKLKPMVTVKREWYY